MKVEHVLAQRITQGGKCAFLFSLPISVALELLEIPDPTHPFPDNRRVSKRHALDFGNYWEANVNGWIVPPLLLDAANAIKFKVISSDGRNRELVNLELSAADHQVLRILDGQHRILGWHLKKVELDKRLEDSTSMFNKLVIEDSKRESEIVLSAIKITTDTIQRLEDEYVTINLLDSLSKELHQQYFVDIAKNALGINKTVQAKFDSASVINRVTQKIIKQNSLFKNRVDMEKTSCSGSNPNLLAVVNVSDVTRHACFGVNRKVTSKRESSYTDQVLEVNVNTFLASMVKKIPQLRQIIDGTLAPAVFREKFMLGSGTIWRCLAGTFYETCVITDDDAGTIEIDESQLKKFEKFLELLSRDMGLPISRQWFATTLFPTRRSKAPSSRAQDLEAMVGLMSAYARNGVLFVPKKPSGL